MILSASATFLPHSLSEDAAQTAARISVDRFKDVRFAVFEVLIPSSQSPAQILADRSHAPSLRTPCLFANRIFEFVHAFLTRPLHSPVQNDSPESRTLRLDWRLPVVF